MNEIQNICPNCGNERSGEFCPRCGQPRLHKERMTFFNYIRQMIGTAIDIEGSVVKTLKALILQPGKLTVEFLSERSVSYISPFKLYLIVSAFYFIFAWGPMLELQRFDEQVDTLIKTNLANFPKAQNNPDFNNAVKERYVDYYGISRFTNVFLIAGWALVAFRSSGKVYGEHNIFVLNYATFDFGLNTVVVTGIIALRDHAGIDLPGSVLFLPLAVTFWYIVLAAKKVYGGSWSSIITRSAILFVGDMALTMVSSMITLTAAISISFSKL